MGLLSFLVSPHIVVIIFLIERLPFIVGSTTILLYLGLWVSWGGEYSVLKWRQSWTNQNGGHPTPGCSFLIAAYSLIVAITFFPSENISYRFLKGLFSWFLTTVLGIASTSFELF